MPDGVDDLLGRGRGRSGLPGLGWLTLPTCDRDVLRSTDRAALRVRPRPRKDVAGHRSVDRQLTGAGDEISADRPRRRDRELASGRREILLEGAADRDRPTGDPRVTADGPVDGDPATSCEDVVG